MIDHRDEFGSPTLVFREVEGGVSKIYEQFELAWVGRKGKVEGGLTDWTSRVIGQIQHLPVTLDCSVSITPMMRCVVCSWVFVRQSLA